MKKNARLPDAATELALLETVGWSAMSVSAGDPSRIPVLIRGEPHASAAELRAILLNGGVTKASVHAASFLWTRIGDRLDADVSPWVQLLVDMAVGTDLSFLAEGFDWAAPATKAKFGRLQRPLVEQMRSGPVEVLGASTIMEKPGRRCLSARVLWTSRCSCAADRPPRGPRAHRASDGAALLARA